jgi:hypothetical protein
MQHSSNRVVIMLLGLYSKFCQISGTS